MVLESLPDDVYKVLEGKSIHDPEIVSRFSSRVSDVLSRRLVKEDRKPSLRVSNIGRPLRQLWYEMNNYPGEEISGKALLKFLYGDLTEALAIALIEASGYETSRFQEEVVVDGVKGHIDIVINGVLVDVKSCSDFSFQKFKTGKLLEDGQDPFGYKAQLAGYAHALGLPAAWIAVNKVDGEISVLELPKGEIDAYDVQARIQACKESISHPLPPERCYPDEPFQKSGNRKLAVGCSYCGWKKECWKDANNGQGLRVFMYSDRPVFMTHVEVEPRVFESKL